MVRWQTEGNTPERGLLVRDLTMRFGDFVVQRDLSFHVAPASIFVIMGESGCGKSTLLRHIIDLQRSSQGDISYDGQRLTSQDFDERAAIQKRIGVLFQSTALWSAMTVGENIALPMQLHTRMKVAEIRDQVAFKLALVGLAGQQQRMPSELSGGMAKRAGIARAIALDPDYLFLDEPSAGLDPITSQRLDALIMRLRDALGLSVVAVTHELPSIFTIADDSIFLDAEARTAIAHGNPNDLLKNCEHPQVRAFLARKPVERVEAAGRQNTTEESGDGKQEFLP